MLERPCDACTRVWIPNLYFTVIGARCERSRAIRKGGARISIARPSIHLPRRVVFEVKERDKETETAALTRVCAQKDSIPGRRELRRETDTFWRVDQFLSFST